MRIIDQVSNILKVSRAARNNDKELFIIYAQKFGLNLSAEQIATFRRMPSFESIRRRRQILQEQGLYSADEAVNEQRYHNYEAIKGGDILVEMEQYKSPTPPEAVPVLLKPGTLEYEIAMNVFDH